MKNVKLVTFPCNFDPQYGSLVPVEANDNIPFDIRRIYYIYDVPMHTRRGFHSHRDLQQALVCVHGSVSILTKTPQEQLDTVLDGPTKALLIGPMVWREMYDFSDDAVLLVLASEHYTVSDYVRDYEQYEKEANEYFANGEQ